MNGTEVVRMDTDAPSWVPTLDPGPGATGAAGVVLSSTPEPAAPTLTVTLETVPRHGSCPRHTCLSEHHEPQDREAEAGQPTRLPPGISFRLRAQGPRTSHQSHPPLQLGSGPVRPPHRVSLLPGGQGLEGGGQSGGHIPGYEEEAEPQRVLKPHLELAPGPDSTPSASPLPSLSSEEHHREKFPH